VKLQTLHGLNWLGWHLRNTLLCKQGREDSRGKITGYSEHQWFSPLLYGYLFLRFKPSLI